MRLGGRGGGVKEDRDRQETEEIREAGREFVHLLSFV